MNVFTYGSLMYPQVWERVVRGAYRNAPAELSGYARHAIVGVSYPGAVASAGARIRGRVYFDVRADDLVRLDAFESDEYRRVDVDLVLSDPAPGGSAAVVAAQLYLYLLPDRLLAPDWDPAAFEREHLERFAELHGAGQARGN